MPKPHRVLSTASPAMPTRPGPSAPPPPHPPPVRPPLLRGRLAASTSRRPSTATRLFAAAASPDRARRARTAEAEGPQAAAVSAVARWPERSISAWPSGARASAAPRGGDFAEVFAESRRGFALVDRRVADRARPGGRRARAPGSASSAARPPTSPTSTASPRPTCCAPPRRPRRPSTATAASRRPLEATATDAAARSSSGPRTFPAERKAELLRALDERARAAGAEVAQLQPPTARAAAASPSPTPRACWSRRPHPGAARRPGRRPARRRRRDGLRDPRRPPRLRAARRRPRRRSPSRPRARPSPCSTPTPLPPGRCRWWSAAASAASSSTR